MCVYGNSGHFLNVLRQNLNHANGICMLPFTPCMACMEGLRQDVGLSGAMPHGIMWTLLNVMVDFQPNFQLSLLFSLTCFLLQPPFLLASSSSPPW